MSRRICAFLGAVMLVSATGVPRARCQGFSDEAVEKAIQRGKQYLWSLYRDTGSPWPEPEPRRNAQGKLVPYKNYGGRSALAMYALLACGESYNDPRMKRALEWQSRLETTGTYTLGLRCQIWALLPQRLGRRLLLKDARQLIASICRPQGAASADLAQQTRYGAYTYISDGTPARTGDNSNTQFGILGVWAAARRNVEVPKPYWELVCRHWIVTQNPDGGWGYPLVGSTRATMTAAGLASMFVAIDNLYADRFVRCGVDHSVPTITKALKWFDKNFDPARSVGGGPYHYYLYAVERVGLASGYKYFGKKDWYKQGAARLIQTQRRAGDWGGLIKTSFALLFLFRGRNPVVFNRLQYEGDWNNRPRALANLTRWISRTFEREVNWQIINLRVPVKEWHDAPILLITGSKKPDFSEEDLEKLRTFVWQGGLILSVAECGSKGRAFDQGMREVYAKLFPHYELSALPPDHPIFTCSFRIGRRARLWGLSNGVRLLAIHTPTDLSLPWQKNAYATSRSAFRTAFNILFYATDHRPYARHRGTSPWPEETDFTERRRVRVARVRYQGNWNPEPLAWERFRRLAGSRWGLKVVLDGPVDLQSLDARRQPVAALTGTGSLSLSRAQKQALKAYVQAGGTLIMDAAGGSKTFADSAVALVTKLFGDGSLRRLPHSSPVYRIPGWEVRKVRYRRAARARFLETHKPRILAVEVAGRPAVFLSREDLTGGLVGYPCFTCVGYAPESAVELMRNLVLFGCGVGRPAGGS